MGMFGPPPPPAPPDHGEPLTSRKMIPSLGVLGFGGASGAAVALAALDLLKHDPKEGFLLLENMGPKVLMALLGMIFIWDIARRILRMISRAVDRLIDKFGQLVTGVAGMSSAMNAMASKDDRQTQEMQTLTSFTAQQTEKLYQKVSEGQEQQKQRDVALIAYLDRMNKQLEGNQAAGSQQRSSG